MSLDNADRHPRRFRGMDGTEAGHACDHGAFPAPVPEEFVTAPPIPRGRHVARADPPRTPRLGRLVAIALVSALLPGSGHLATGHRRAGRWILVGFLVLVAGVSVAAVVTWRSPETVASLAVRPTYLRALRWGAVALGAAWITVVASAVLFAHPRAVGRGGRLLAVALTSALALGIAVPTVTVSRYADTTEDTLSEVFRDSEHQGGAQVLQEPAEAFADGRLNVLLVGADSGDNRVGLRSDTVILASVDTDTGKSIMFSLPRNLQKVPFPPGTPMAERWPNGFDCGDDCLLNAIWQWAEENRALFPDDPRPGLTALRGAVSETLGLPVEYYALVDLGGFRSLIDALGGVSIRVERPIPIGGGTSPISGYIPPGLQHLDGYHALWYARSRADSDDYQRIGRQRCLLGAIAREADPTNVLLNYQKVAASTKDAVETDMPRELLPNLVKLAFRVKSEPIRSIAFTPPLVPSTANADFDRIRDIVGTAIARSEATTEAAPPSARPSPEGGQPSGEPEPAPEPERTEDPAVSLDEVCAYE